MHDAHVFASGFAHAAVVVSIDLPHWLAAELHVRGGDAWLLTLRICTYITTM